MNFGEGEQAVTTTADLESESIEISRLPSSSSSICFDREKLEDKIFPFDEPGNNVIGSINKSSISSESTSERRSPNDDADADAATEATTGQRPQHEKNVLPDRPSQDVARDTKRILEICYGNTKGVSTALVGDDAVVTENEEKEDGAKRKKKKKTLKKRRKKNDKKLSTALIGDDAVAIKRDGANREKKTQTSEKRRKKDGKIKKEKNTVQMKSIRDATGKIVRKPRKIKDRHRVVRKDLIKRGKDVKTELSTISEDLNGDDDDDDDDEDDDDDDENGNHINNDSESFVSITIDEEEDIYHNSKDVSNTSKEEKEDDDDNDDGGGDEDDDLKSEVDEQETDADYHDTEESKMGSCTEDEEDINTEKKMNSDECIEEDRVSPEIERCPDHVRNDDDSVIPNDVDSVLQNTPIIIATTPTIQLPDIENHLTSPSSVDSTECTSTGGYDLEEKSSTFYGSYRMKICCGALFVVTVAALTVLAFYLISLYDIFPGPSFTPTNSPQADQYPSLRPSLTPTLPPSISTYLSPDDGPSSLVTTLSPSKMLEPSSIPTVTPTSAPTTILNTSSTSCQLPVQTVDVQTLEAEDASKKMGNVIISDENEGYCGEGYLTNLMGIGSGFEFAPLEVNTTGYYRVALRYNYNEKSAISLHLKIDDTEKGQFDLISTGNKTTWMVDGIDNILLSQGEHVVQLSVLSETDDGPHIDWLTVSMLEPVSRFDYLVILLAQLTDVTTPSQSQISALVWMASEDPMDWSSLTDQEIIERYALVQIYYSASGDIWFNTNEWLSEFHVCTWYGIACSKEELATDLMLGKINYSSFFDEAKIDILQPDS